MAETAQRTSVPRERVPLTIDASLVDWINSHSQAGGYFGTPSHATERALARLRAEQEFVRTRCREKGTTFTLTAFWRIYAPDLQDSMPGPAGRPARGAARVSQARLKFYASIANELLDWIAQFEGKPFVSLSQAIEVGLRQLRRVDQGEPLPPDVEALWARYLKALG
jgi:hypothetical protein